MQFGPKGDLPFETVGDCALTVGIVRAGQVFKRSSIRRAVGSLSMSSREILVVVVGACRSTSGGAAPATATAANIKTPGRNMPPSPDPLPPIAQMDAFPITGEPRVASLSARYDGLARPPRRWRRGFG